MSNQPLRLSISVRDAFDLRRDRVYFWENDIVKQIGHAPDDTYLLHMPEVVVRVTGTECLEYTEHISFRRTDWFQMRSEFLRKKQHG